MLLYDENLNIENVSVILSYNVTLRLRIKLWSCIHKEMRSTGEQTVTCMCACVCVRVWFSSSLVIMWHTVLTLLHEKCRKHPKKWYLRCHSPSGSIFCGFFTYPVLFFQTLLSHEFTVPLQQIWQVLNQEPWTSLYDKLPQTVVGVFVRVCACPLTRTSTGWRDGWMDSSEVSVCNTCKLQQEGVCLFHFVPNWSELPGPAKQTHLQNQTLSCSKCLNL